MDALGDVATLIALVVAGVSLWYAFKADRQSEDAARSLSDVKELTASAKAGVGALKTTAADQAASLGELNEQIEAIGLAVDQVAFGGSQEPDDSGESDQAFAESALMAPIPLARLDTDIQQGVKGAAESPVKWALRRRGPGIPRWLVGTEDGRAWRAIRRKGVNVKQAASVAAEHALEPVDIDALNASDDAREALQRMLEPDERVEVLLRRKARGAPVYYGPTTKGRILRLVHTRWGWGGAPESE